jgi:hypothetical protein
MISNFFNHKKPKGSWKYEDVFQEVGQKDQKNKKK